ncbi:hypothetical protein [Mycolicibacterium sp. S2-37]|nr:hypothetical protein [Mycolicibacterium sp. S2-37]
MTTTNSYSCPHCRKAIGYMPKEDVHGKKTNLPACPYRKRRGK